VPTGDFLNGNAVRLAVAKLRGANVPTFNGFYKGIIHPDVSYDFRGATGGTNWSDPHVYSDPAGIWNGYIGAFQGVQFMESPRAPLFSGGGASGVDVYRTLVMGRQAVAMAYSNGGGYTGGQNPTYVDIPIVDVLRRFEGIGWKWLGGFSVFRQAALYGIESASTIAVNA
jgi:N4-gp56 family major capsid protein